MEEANDLGMPVVERVPARAALAGNPSDGYAGAVFAVPVDAYAVTVSVRRAAAWSIVDDLAGHRGFRNVDELRRAIGDNRADRPHALILATLGWFLEQTPVAPPSVAISATSTVPVSVGLAGSSAIVIGVLRALHRVALMERPRPLSLAHIALAVETNALGITAGLQDRLVQSFGRPVLMRFDRPGDFEDTSRRGDRPVTTEVVEPGGDFRLMVAHRSAWSEPSQVVHGDLRRRHDAGDAAVHAAMGRLAAQAIEARHCFEIGDVAGLGRSMDATFDLRAQMIDLVPGHVEMIGVARAAGAAANYTGSGGAVVILSPDQQTEGRARQSLKRLGCEIVPVAIESVSSSPATGSAD